jgi:hypothetical protein
MFGIRQFRYTCVFECALKATAAVQALCTQYLLLVYTQQLRQY